MYHRVVNAVPGLAPPTWNVCPTCFRSQLRGLLRRGFQAWSLNKVLFHRDQGLSIPRKVFVVTFDDAYECVFTNALPILKELRVPATIFLATQFLDSQEPFPSDDWSGKGSSQAPPESWRPLSVAQCKTMLESGLIEIGAHTHSHGDFRNKPVALANDLKENMEFLQRTFGLAEIPFAFPYGTKSSGYYSSNLAHVAQECGLRCALHTEPEMANVDGNVFDWGRFNVEPSDTAFTLSGKLTGWFSYWKQRFQTEAAPAVNRVPQSESLAALAPASSIRSFRKS
jgi:peptidoglycan/xylan/chitin deacetylase (PgdA/CDA1 family)